MRAEVKKYVERYLVRVKEGAEFMQLLEELIKEEET